MSDVGADFTPNGSIPPAPMPPQLGLLRWVAAIGTGGILLWRATSLTRMQPRQDWSIVILVLATLAVGLTCLVLMPAATARLRRHLDLLLPLGLYLTATELLSGLMAIQALSAVFSPSWSFTILSLSFSLSIVFLLQIALAVLFAGWTTILVVQAVKEERVDPLQGFRGTLHSFWRVLGAELLAWGVLFLVLGVTITLGVVVLPLALIAIGVFALVWNLMTAALLPVIVAQRKPFGESLRDGIRVSWEGKSRWWLPVIVQMVLLGWITFFVVSYSSNPRPGFFTTQSKRDFSVNAFWTGGYENDCRWHSKLMAAVEAEPLPLAKFLLGILFTVLAIVVKLEITGQALPQLYPKSPLQSPRSISPLEDELPDLE